ncbi:hypothetical protein [Fodinicola feengrottensis]|uniref:hypothetical protein n=1 Tax=Fodinicola feengrottensis TaxID=435914 RepID=UPI0013D21298|nr:hypothetical protein [Fodinicola feengrottensis]
MMAGLIRWARTARYLREELVPAGWHFDNPQNLPRTIHPSGDFAIVAITGDELTGGLDVLPTTKHPRGPATALAVATNEQLNSPSTSTASTSGWPRAGRWTPAIC